jgi:hypothetical protein
MIFPKILIVGSSLAPKEFADDVEGLSGAVGWRPAAPTGSLTNLTIPSRLANAGRSCSKQWHEPVGASGMTEE